MKSGQSMMQRQSIKLKNEKYEIAVTTIKIKEEY
jgi:hypothetical protein